MENTESASSLYRAWHRVFMVSMSYCTFNLHTNLLVLQLFCPKQGKMVFFVLEVEPGLVQL